MFDPYNIYISLLSWVMGNSYKMDLLNVKEKLISLVVMVFQFLR